MSTKANNPMICFAHRGASGYEPENTLRSFAKALELGASWIECDVRYVDNELIIFHDRTLRRMTGNAGNISQQKLANLRAMTIKGGERIPLLSELLELIKGKAKVNLELKGQGAGAALAAYISHLLQAGWSADSFIISSFDHDEVSIFKALCPSVPVGILLYGYPLHTLKIAQDIGAFSVHIDSEATTQKRVESLHAAGLKVFVYTVNEPEEIEAMRAMGVDGVFSDYPDRVLCGPAL